MIRMYYLKLFERVIIIFQGFNEKTSKFFFLMTFNNNKEYLSQNSDAYNNYVKCPLRALQSELSKIVLEIDNDICTIPSRCISGIYNDVRFGNKDMPLRNYMWVRYKCLCQRDTDIPGFFFDASYNNYRYGLRIYNMSTGGMKKIREAILNNTMSFEKLTDKFDEAGIFGISGKEYIKDHHPDYKLSIKKWLNKRDFYIYCTKDIEETYYSEKLVEELTVGYQSLRELYIFLKKALANG